MKSVTYLLDELVVPQFEIPRVSHRLHHGSTPLRFQTDARPTSSLSSRDLRLTIQSPGWLHCVFWSIARLSGCGTAALCPLGAKSKGLSRRAEPGTLPWGGIARR